MENLIVSGVPLLVIVFGLVEFAKKLGAQGNTLTVVSAVIGLVLGVAFKLSEMYPAFALWFQVVVFGLAIGLAACGLYDFMNARLPKAQA
jgi:hypothetical protein